MATAGFTVTVQDGAPVVTVPGAMTLEATGATGAVATYTASAVDAVDGTVGVACAPASGTLFGLGATAVTCTATDSVGQVAAAAFAVTVLDRTAPVVTVPGAQVFEATSAAGITVAFDASSVDVVDGAVTIFCTPPSGTTFGLGVTTVTCAATDASGNAAVGSFTVTVRDTGAPVLTVPPAQMLEATGPTGAVATFTATALDAIDGGLVPTCTPASGTTFGPGATTVSCTATDASGNATTGSFTVTVVDTTAPVLTVPAALTVEATSAAGAPVSFTATALDVVDGAVTAVCAPVSGMTFALGVTPVTCTATDRAGNQAGATFTVTVRM
jgi:hypothetical protein